MEVDNESDLDGNEVSSNDFNVNSDLEECDSDDEDFHKHKDEDKLGVLLGIVM